MLWTAFSCYTFFGNPHVRKHGTLGNVETLLVCLKEQATS